MLELLGEECPSKKRNYFYLLKKRQGITKRKFVPFSKK